MVFISAGASRPFDHLEVASVSSCWLLSAQETVQNGLHGVC